MMSDARRHSESKNRVTRAHAETTFSLQMPDDLWMVMSGARSDEAVLSEITASMGPKSDKGSTVYNGLVENRKKKHAFMSFLREAAGTMQAVTSANARNRAQDAVGISTQANETKADDGAGRNRIDFNFPSFLGMEKRSVDAVVSGGGYMFATAHGPEAKPNELYMRGLKMESSSGPRFGVRKFRTMCILLYTLLLHLYSIIPSISLPPYLSLSLFLFLRSFTSPLHDATFPTHRSPRAPEISTKYRTGETDSIQERARLPLSRSKPCRRKRRYRT